MGIYTKPAFTFAEFKARNPDTRYTKETYCAAQFKHREAGSEETKPGDVFSADGFLWRVTLINENWTYAVPWGYPENYWE